jgi:hypothetical protein
MRGDGSDPVRGSSGWAKLVISKEDTNESAVDEWLRCCRDAMHRVSTVSPAQSGSYAGRGRMRECEKTSVVLCGTLCKKRKSYTERHREDTAFHRRKNSIPEHGIIESLNF